MSIPLAAYIVSEHSKSLGEFMSKVGERMFVTGENASNDVEFKMRYRYNIEDEQKNFSQKYRR